MTAGTLQHRPNNLAEAYRHEAQTLNGDDQWARSEALKLAWLRSPRFVESTRDEYKRVYAAWLAWCVEIQVAPLDARRTHLEGYTLFLAKAGNPASKRPRPVSRRTVARHMAIISSYYRRGIVDEVTTYNPVPPTDRPQVSRQSRQPHLTPEEIRALIAAADAAGVVPSALVALLTLACLRVSEALRLAVEDVTREAGGYFAWVTRKGDKGERVPLPPQAHERLKAAAGARKDGPILLGPRGNALNRRRAWGIVRQLGQQAGIPTPIGPHTLRHAYITRGHELGVPVADLQDAAGHVNVDTTRGYDRRRFDPATHPSFIIARDLLGEAEAPGETA